MRPCASEAFIGGSAYLWLSCHPKLISIYDRIHLRNDQTEPARPRTSRPSPSRHPRISHYEIRLTSPLALRGLRSGSRGRVSYIPLCRPVRVVRDSDPRYSFLPFEQILPKNIMHPKRACSGVHESLRVAQCGRVVTVSQNATRRLRRGEAT